jgi:N-acetylgalactosamine-6-sulfatase
MNRRSFFTLAGGATLPMRSAAPKTPNVVLILADDLGSGDVSSFGCPDIKTPHIDSIGRAGVRFTQSYSNGPECTPTRTALLTGRYQQRVGGMECALGVGNVGRYDDAQWLREGDEMGLPASETSLAQILKRRGYDTGCFGKWHLGYPKKFWPMNHGFDESFGILGGGADYFTHKEDDGTPVLYRNDRIVEQQGYTTDLFAGEAAGWLKRRSGRPFFLYLPFTSPHQPLQDPDAFDPKTGTAPVATRDRRIYRKMVERMDRRIGDVLAQLEVMGAVENTLVIFTSDNGGEPNGRNATSRVLRGNKGSLWEGGTRTVCMARWPAMLAPGKTTSQVTLSMDLMATILAAAGAEPPAGRKLDGVNLLGVLKGEKKAFARTVFWRSKRGERVRKCVREGNLKLVIDQGETELHDLGTDEFEERNLLPAAAADAERLKKLLAAWELDVMAPRLRPFRNTPG